MANKQLPPPPIGKMERQWVTCAKHGGEAYYDYIPYGLTANIMVMPCGCGGHTGNMKNIDEPLWVKAAKTRKSIKGHMGPNDGKLASILDALPDESLERLAQIAKGIDQ